MSGPELTTALIAFAIVLGSLSVHEAAHAWTADRLGDPTARRLGRLTLDPRSHIDPIGTLLLPLLAIASGLPVIGWARPVPVNPMNLRDFRRDFMVIAAAGPASNLLLAVGAALLVRTPLLGMGGGLVGQVAIGVIHINVLLAVFNLIPVPPLDGGNVIGGLLPPSLARSYDRVRPFGFLLLYAMMFTGVLSQIIWPPSIFLVRLLLP